jgi:hypothetical protein
MFFIAHLRLTGSVGSYQRRKIYPSALDKPGTRQTGGRLADRVELTRCKKIPAPHGLKDTCASIPVASVIFGCEQLAQLEKMSKSPKTLCRSARAASRSPRKTRTVASAVEKVFRISSGFGSGVREGKVRPRLKKELFPLHLLESQAMLYAAG